VWLDYIVAYISDCPTKAALRGGFILSDKPDDSYYYVSSHGLEHWLGVRLFLGILNLAGIDI